MMNQHAFQGRGSGKEDHQQSGRGFGYPAMSKFQKIAAMRAESRTKMLQRQYSLIDPSPTLIDPRTSEIFRRVLSTTDATQDHHHQTETGDNFVFSASTGLFETMNMAMAMAMVNDSNELECTAEDGDENPPSDEEGSVAEKAQAVEHTARFCGVGRYQSVPPAQIINSSKGGYFICRPDQVDLIQKSSVQ